MDFIQSSGYKWFLHHKLLWKSNESYGISSHNAAQRPTHKDFAHILGEPWSPEMDPSLEISALVNERIWSFTTFVPSYLCAPILLQFPCDTQEALHHCLGCSLPSYPPKHVPGLEVRFPLGYCLSLLAASCQAWTAFGWSPGSPSSSSHIFLKVWILFLFPLS